MKKSILIYLFVAFLPWKVGAQAISDSKSIPFDLTLQEILRVNITSGGNIEFVFNTIKQYNSGILNSSFYDTNVQIASSSDWQLHFGAEGDLIGTDNSLNSINKNNIGFTVSWNGLNTCCDPLGAGGTQVTSSTGVYDNAPTGIANGLALFTGIAGDVLFTLGTVGTNGGDVLDNKFTINWECGTKGAGTTPMNASSLLGSKSDRYVTTVYIELETL